MLFRDQFRVMMCCFALSVAAVSAPAYAVESISPKEAAAKVEKSLAILIDVREHDETVLGMAAPASEMPLSEAKANTPKWQAFVQSLPKTKDIILYCRSGHRAGIVAGMLAEKGITNVKNMGGFQAWADAGLPVKKP